MTSGLSIPQGLLTPSSLKKSSLNVEEFASSSPTPSPSSSLLFLLSPFKTARHTLFPVSFGDWAHSVD